MSTITKRTIAITLSSLILINVAFGIDSLKPNFTDFFKSLEQGTDEQAAQTGQQFFERLERKYRADTGFGVLKSKITAADFLANQMITQLKKATGQQIFNVAGELFEDKVKNRNLPSIPPAKDVYETSQQIFRVPINISQIEDEEKKFLAKFYDLKLRILTSKISKAGQVLAIAEPSFKGTYDYVLVLPLLHASETNPVNIDVFPKWMRESNQLQIFSDSCLLHYGMPWHAQTFAKIAAKQDKKVFSQTDFYRSASQKCAKQLPHVAVDCLKRAIDLTGEEQIDERVNLQFDIVQIWLDSGSFALAAGEAQNIADNFGDHEKSGNAIWLQFYALSKANNAESILTNIDAAISDPRCADYQIKLMYIKWWALRRQRNQGALIAALEHELITEYKDNEMIAPIMLSRATDLLAEQDYAGARMLLEQLQEKFPSTTAAKRANKITKKLKSMAGAK